MPRVVSLFPNSQGCRGNGTSPILFGRHAHLADISIRFDLDERLSRTATEETLLKSFTAGAAIYDESCKPSPRSLSAKLEARKLPDVPQLRISRPPSPNPHRALSESRRSTRWKPTSHRRCSVCGPSAVSACRHGRRTPLL